MEPFKVEEAKKTTSDIKIAVVGVGGGGCNMVSHLAETIDSENIELFAMNTDVQALDSMKSEKIISSLDKI